MHTKPHEQTKPREHAKPRGQRGRPHRSPDRNSNRKPRRPR
jgi:hypothetical protein